VTAAQPNFVQFDGAKPQRRMLLLAVVPVIALFIFVLTLALGYPSNRYVMVGLALLTIVIALLPAIIDQGRPIARRHMLLTIYGLLFAAHFGLPIFTQYLGAVGPSDPPGVSGGALFPAEVVRGQVIALAGLLSFLIGYVLLPARLSDQQIARRKARDWSLSVILTVSAFMLVLGWTISVTRTLGLIPAALGSGVISTIASSVIFGNALLTVAYLRYQSRLAWILLFIAVPVSTVLGFFTGSKRQTLLVPAIVLFTSMLLGGRLRARWIVIGALVLAMLYPIAQFYREDVLQDNTLTIVDALSDPGRTIGVLSDFLNFAETRGGRYLGDGLEATAARLDAVGILSVIVRDTPRVSPYQNGRTLNLFFIAFVPRVFWEGKPEITLGQWITDTYGSGTRITSYTGPSFIGDLYLNFGTASVVMGMLFTGALLRLFQTRMLGPSPTAVGILAAIIVLAQIIIKQIGSAAFVLSSTVFAFGPVFIVYLMVRLMSGGNSVPLVPTWSDQAEAQPSS
jgi:hypothetical protein